MNIKSEKIILLIIGFILICFIFIYYQSEMQLSSSDFIRFHVIANSNTEEDQALKLKVRDAVLEEVSPKLSKLNSVKESRKWLMEHSEEINRLAENTIKKEGKNYRTDVNLGMRWIPEKSYGNITLPAGNYEAFTIEIGEAKGENWWCVMFPPICIIGENPEEYAAEISKEFDSTKYQEMIGYCEGDTPYVLKFHSVEIYEKILNMIKNK